MIRNSNPLILPLLCPESGGWYSWVSSGAGCRWCLCSHGPFDQVAGV